MQKRTFAFGLVVALYAGRADAHDYWLEPQSGSIRLVVGDHFWEEEERGFERAKFSAIDLWSASGKTSLMGALTEGSKPFVRIAFDRSGSHLIAVERPLQTITLAATKFEAYLREEGLYPIVEQRAARGESSVPGRERYTRHLKAWMHASGQAGDLHAKPIGQRLEILVDTNPATLSSGTFFSVRVLFEGKPLAGARVELFVRERGMVATQAQTTSQAGGATFLAFPGTLLVRLVHMRRCSGCADADWESFWASYAFGIASTG